MLDEKYIAPLEIEATPAANNTKQESAKPTKQESTKPGKQNLKQSSGDKSEQNERPDHVEGEETVSKPELASKDTAA